MKSMFKLPFVAVAFAMAIPFSQAEDAATPPPPLPPPPPGEHGPGPGGPGHGPRGDRFKMMVEKLNLTEDQKTKIKPIMEEEMKAMAAVRDDESLGKAARREKIMEIVKRTRDQIRPLLTPEQQKTLDEMKERGYAGPHKEKAKEKAKD